MKEKWQEFCGSNWHFVLMAITLIVFALFSWGMYNVYNKEKQKVIDTPPSDSLIKEDLERELVTLDVVLIDTEQDEDVFIAKVWANGGIFRAEYRIDSYNFVFYWKFVDVKMIGVVERP
nr:MAG TPA: hypothetical protein [Caudoviricetes sp.]